MRFVVTREIHQNSVLRVFLVLFHISTLFYLLMNILMERHKWGLTPEAIATTILGNEQLFVQSKDLQVLLTDIHVEMFIYIFIAAMVILVGLRRQISEIQKRVSIFLTFLFLMLNETSPLLVLLGWENAASTKWVSFWGLSILLITSILSNLFFLLSDGHENKALSS